MSTNDLIVLSHTTVAPILSARSAGMTTAQASLDLGLTTDAVLVQPERVVFPNGGWLDWDQLATIIEDEQHCFVVEDNTARRIQRFSEQLNRFYSLMPTDGPPTVLIAGFSMHRIKGTDPRRDTLAKVRTLTPLRGRVLDTSTGLGYTAIEAAKTAEQVVTIELDPTTLMIARLNPWSQALFDNPKIQQLIGDSFDVLPELADHAFARIIHDPPTFSLAGQLYSGAFYQQLFRVLKPSGRLFHYIGNLESKTGHGLLRGVVRRLKESGFERIVRRPEAFGLVAYKERP
jgi:predicted methyltransferase